LDDQAANQHGDGHSDEDRSRLRSDGDGQLREPVKRLLKNRKGIPNA